MADISEITRQQLLIEANVEQMKCEAWELLRDHSEDWVDALDGYMQGFAESPRDGIRAIGLLAQIGYSHMLASVFVGDGM